MATKRSPILGYNHNIRHRGRVFHVQTEDSGVDNPHIFTHLFHGGVILSSRKLDYDRASSEEAVKGLMQAQHKAVLKELKKGTFDAKIVEYLGPHPEGDLPPDAAPHVPERPQTEPGSARLDSEPVPVPPDMPPPVELPVAPPAAAPEVHVSFSAAPSSGVPEPAAPEVTAPMGSRTPPRAEPASSTYIHTGRGRREAPLMNTGQMAAVMAPDDAAPTEIDAEPTNKVVDRHMSNPPPIPATARRRPTRPPRRVPSSQTNARPRPPSTPAVISAREGSSRRTASRKSDPNVIVSRPAVIVGAPPKVVGSGSDRQSARAPATVPNAAPASSPPPQSRPASGRVRAAREERSAPNSLFGGDLISEKSLDEVILAYLSEDTGEE